MAPDLTKRNSSDVSQSNGDPSLTPDAKPCLLIGTPCYGRMVTDLYVASVLKLQMACLEHNVRFQIKMIGGDALIPRARQTIVTHFLSDPTATHLLFIDADIGFEPEQVFRLLAFDADVTAAVYPLKRMDWGKVAATAAANRVPLPSGSLSYLVQFANEQRLNVRDNFVQIEYAGTGFLMIRRRVLYAMIQQYPELRYAQEHKPNDPLTESPFRYALFNPIIDQTTGTYLPEDYSFCRRWTEMGGEIWADLQSRLIHVGAINFTGDFTTQFSMAPA
jgi:hypothetical protein